MTIFDFLKCIFWKCSKHKTLFGKKLIFWVGVQSADDIEADSWAEYQLIEGKVRKRVIDKMGGKRKGKPYFIDYKRVEITPITNTALILYKTHEGSNINPIKKYRVRLFRNWHKNKGIIRLNNIGVKYG